MLNCEKKENWKCESGSGKKGGGEKEADEGKGERKKRLPSALPKIGETGFKDRKP